MKQISKNNYNLSTHDSSQLSNIKTKLRDLKFTNDSIVSQSLKSPQSIR